MSSSKNKLQEVFQKRGEQLPQYSTTSVGGAFVSVVTLADGRSFTSSSFPSKKVAELDAAEKAIAGTVKPDRLTAGIHPQVVKLRDISPSPPPKSVLLIDLENMNKDIDL